MKVVVGSTNPAKIEGVRRAFTALFGAVDIVGVQVSTSVGSQPIGLRSVIIGAVERAVNALRLVEGDFGVGVEAGLVEVPATVTGYMDFQACAIVDNQGLVSLGFGPGFEFPPQAVDEVIKGLARELEEPMVRLTGIERIGEKGGAIKWLSRGAMDRETLTEMATMMALIPRLNSDLYPLRRADEVLAELSTSD